MLWDLLQQRQIGRAQQSANQAANSIDQTQEQLGELERTVQTLMLSCQAMWELLREKTNVTDEMLQQRMQEVDLRDGRRDGRMGSHVSTCLSCSRPNNASRESCVYCGRSLPPPQHVFG